MTLPPLVKNVGLAFVAAFVTSLTVAWEGGLPLTKAALTAAGVAAVYAGVRAAVAKLKEALTGEPFKVDTEA